MSKLWIHALPILMAAGLVHPVHAQCTSCASGSGDIRVVRIPSAFGIPGAETPQDLFCTAADTDFTINLASYSWSSDDWVIQIYDCAAASTPTHNIGKVTITGDPSGITSLAVFVAGPAASWSDDPFGFTLSTGCVDFTGLDITDPDVLAKTRVSVAISGDLTQVATAAPGLHANQFVRVQAQGRDGGGGTWIGGNIEGDITAEGGTLFGGGANAIGHIRAWNTISGKIQAVDKNIAAVRVMGNPTGAPTPGGIQNEILAEAGHIGTIFCTGKIGDAGAAPVVLPKIYAADGIEQIRIVDEAAPTTVLDRDINADIQANKDYVVNPSHREPADNAAIFRIETAGDLSGAVKAGNVTYKTELGRSGIFVRGELSAPVTIDCNLEKADIIAGTISSVISVGVHLEGSIVATDSDGQVHEV